MLLVAMEDESMKSKMDCLFAFIWVSGKVVDTLNATRD